MPELGAEIIDLLYMLLYLVVLAVLFSIIYAIAEWFSIDRVLKIISGRKGFVLLGGEAYYGRIIIPPRSGGGFEVLFPWEGLENPQTAIAYLVETYRETGDEKFLKEATRLAAELAERGLVPSGLDVESLNLTPWDAPSLASRKVFPSELGNVQGFILLKSLLTPEELEDRKEDLRKFI